MTPRTATGADRPDGAATRAGARPGDRAQAAERFRRDGGPDDGTHAMTTLAGGPEASRGGVHALPWLLVGLGAAGLAASLVLLIEKIRLLEDPTYVPTCSLSPILSCGSIMTSDQAELFGFPNPVLGLVGFAAVVSAGAALLAGARPARWYWLGLQAGVLGGLIMVGWLAFQSLYRIGALCPYCMAVWAIVACLASAVTAHNAGTGVLPGPPRFLAVVRDYAVLWPLLAAVAVAALAGVRFWDYWSGLL